MGFLSASPGQGRIAGLDIALPRGPHRPEWEAALGTWRSHLREVRDDFLEVTVEQILEVGVEQ